MLKPYRRAQLQFEDVQEVGADGRNSTTWIVNDLQLGAEIVMKTIPKADLNSPDEYFDEAKSLYATAHQNVVQIHYACEDDDCIYIAMPLYRKGSVKSILSDKHLTVREIIRIGCQVLSGLHNIHSKGLIHFDIKPDNILLSDQSEALLSDFGLAKQMVGGLADPNGMYIRMAPPEATAGGPYDIRFDIYQIGLTLYRMAVGNEAFDEQFERFVDEDDDVDMAALGNEIVQGTFPDRQAFAEHVPNKLRSVIVRCLQPDPADRYQSALAVANALAEVEDILDWRLEKDVDCKTWIKNESGTERRFVVKSDGSTEFTTQSPDGQRRRKTALCRASMNKRDIVKVLKEN